MVQYTYLHCFLLLLPCKKQFRANVCVNLGKGSVQGADNGNKVASQILQTNLVQNEIWAN